MVLPKVKFERRQRRTRAALRKRGGGRPRLSVFRSSKHIYVQLIDDQNGRTLAAASTLDKELKGELAASSDMAAAKQVGELVAKRAIEAGIKDAVFDRGGYRYHGRVRAVAEGAREAGLSI
ncbi:MAG: 50S ribosomal protein L18 [Geminicoccaceae bacterium]